MSTGPVEYVVVGFPDNKFQGQIAPALRELVDNGTLRVLDLALVVKDADGNVTAMEAEYGDSRAFGALETIASDRGGFVTASDLEQVGAFLQPNSSAALLLWEDLWAQRFADAVRDAGGVLVDIQRVPHEIVEAAIEWNEQHKAEIEAMEAGALT
jgi:hypothetical protein